jgi:hypothetical protein
MTWPISIHSNIFHISTPISRLILGLEAAARQK